MKVSKTILAILAIYTVISTASAAMIYADADGHPDGSNISNAFGGMTLSSFGDYPGLDGEVYARVPSDPSWASTGEMVFGNNLDGTDGGGIPLNEIWHEAGAPCLQFSLRADFDNTANKVSLDFIGDNHSDYGILEVYNSIGTLLDSVSTPELTSGDVFTAQVNRASFDIKYIIAHGKNGQTVHLDNLCANVPEPCTIALLGIGGAMIFIRHNKSGSLT